MVERLGSARSVSLALAAIAASGVVLAVPGGGPAIAFALLAGFGIGAMSPLQGIVVEELYDRETLGATMGSYNLIGWGGAAGGAGRHPGRQLRQPGLVTAIIVVTLRPPRSALQIERAGRRADGWWCRR